MTGIKRGVIKKIVHLILCLFLMCTFLSFDHNESDLQPEQEMASVSISVPHGTYMEIKTEDSNLNLLANLKVNSYKSCNAIRVLFIVIMVMVLGYTYIHIYAYRAMKPDGYSKFVTIQYIHKKDGRKRI